MLSPQSRKPLVVAWIAVLLVACSAAQSLAGTANLAITSAVDAKKAKLGDDIVYVVTVTNRGPDTATQVSLQVGMHDQFNPVSFTCSEGSQGGEGCTVAALPPGASITAVLVATVCCFPKGESRRAHVYAHVSCDNDPDETNNDTEVVVRIIGGW